MGKNKKSKLPRGARKGRRAMTETLKEQHVAIPAAVEEDVASAVTKTVEKEAPEVENTVVAPETKERKKPGRKPMTQEQKEEAKRLREAKKEAEFAASATVYIQYQGMEANIQTLSDAAIADFKAAHKRTKVVSLRLYVKPEEYAAYYVINDSAAGKINL